MSVYAPTKKEMGKARTSPEILPEPPAPKKKKKSQPTQSKSQTRRKAITIKKK